MVAAYQREAGPRKILIEAAAKEVTRYQKIVDAAETTSISTDEFGQKTKRTKEFTGYDLPALKKTLEEKRVALRTLMNQDNAFIDQINASILAEQDEFSTLLNQWGQ